MFLPEHLDWRGDFLVNKETEEVIGEIVTFYSRPVWAFVESTKSSNPYQNYSINFCSTYRGREFLTQEAVKRAVERQFAINKIEEENYSKKLLEYLPTKTADVTKQVTKKERFIAWLINLLHLN